MVGNKTPYDNRPAHTFWRSAVAEPGLFGYNDLWSSKWTLPKNASFATYGSCFAQHISRALVSKGKNWINAEPAPGGTPPELAKTYNYEVYSARTGNIYTAAQLRQWTDITNDESTVQRIEIWEDAGRFYDSLRPSIEPRGFASEHEAQASLLTAARAFRRSVACAHVFVFTLGLTEGWINQRTGQPYPICPGALAGQFDPDLHQFVNYSYPDTLNDLSSAIASLRKINPDVHILLTVSPVPLTATAEDTHVLLSTTYSKSTLRAVAGDLARSDARIDYFPSYEIIAAPPTRGIFYEQNMRSVAKAGVDLVMTHFFKGLVMSAPAKHGTIDASPTRRELEQKRMDDEDLVCEELILDRFNEA